MNKLGVTEYQLSVIEKEIINKKLNLLNETFTFNHEKLDFYYLIDLHEFLFGEFYIKEESGTRILTDSEIRIIENYVLLIEKECLENQNINNIIDYIVEIWYLQPFIVGNTRTMIAFLKMIDYAFLLDLNVDVNIDIRSNSSMFKESVNQKRLTKSK